MTTPTQRTPQQASIDAKEAREAWERGEIVEFKYKEREWAPFASTEYGQPAFSSPEHVWRVKPTPTPVITPGKWRMRNGEVVEIMYAPGSRWPWVEVQKCFTSKEWDSKGRFHSGQEDPRDLLTRVETKWRPWKPEEVPLGREIRSKADPTHRELLFGSGACADAFTNWELRNPDGTYSPCGVEEEIG